MDVSTGAPMVRHIMMTMSKIDLFAALPRWSTTVSDADRLEGHTDAIVSVSSVSCCVRNRFAPCFISAPTPSHSNCGFRSEPAPALQSP